MIMHAMSPACVRLPLPLQFVASMAAMVAGVQPRTGLVPAMRGGEAGRACGRKAGGAIPVLSVSRHAPRLAASSCHRTVLYAKTDLYNNLARLAPTESQRHLPIASPICSMGRSDRHLFCY